MGSGCIPSPPFSDSVVMRFCLRLARRGEGRTNPNPMVGAVVVKGGEMAGYGYHRGAGLPHAEVEALRRASRRARGGTLYVNLEPCSHYGRTPPCTGEIMRSGIREVVFGINDPNPLVSGRGERALAEGGILVRKGILKRECRDLNRAYIKGMERGLPFVTLKAAMSLDGKIAGSSGISRWISCEESRALVHRIRAGVDAIMVGAGTVFQDDPILTVRDRRGRERGRQPMRVVFDRNLSLPEGRRVFEIDPARTILFTSEGADSGKVARLAKRGVVVETLLKGDGGNIEDALKSLYRKGVLHALLEGGSRMNWEFLKRGLVDEFLLFVSPRILGGKDSPSLVGGEGFPGPYPGIDLTITRIRRIGRDILLMGKIDTRKEDGCSRE